MNPQKVLLAYSIVANKYPSIHPSIHCTSGSINDYLIAIILQLDQFLANKEADNV